MKKQYTCFRISEETGALIDLEWGRYNTEEECYNMDVEICFSYEILILPIYVPQE